MTANETQGAPAPVIRIPPSPNTVDVSIINTTGVIHNAGSAGFFGPQVKGLETFDAPIFSFLIQHSGPGGATRSLLFDLGLRKDWWNMSPVLVGLLKSINWTLEVKQGVREVLDAGGVDTAAIEAIIISHHHFDHVGDTTTFEPSTALVVGPGYKEHAIPGYPTNPESMILETDYTGRDVLELDFNSPSEGKWKTLAIGPFRAIDYFHDGSFYLLDTPGHAVGHISALARVSSSASASTSDPDAYILMAGDGFHHAGQLRPSPFHPLPEEITPSPLANHSGGCSCSLFKPLLPDGTASPFYTPAGPGGWHHDSDEAKQSVRKLQELDALEGVFVLAAHDASVLGVVDFFPEKVDGKRVAGWDREARWRFLGDFSEAVAEGEQ